MKARVRVLVEAKQFVLSRLARLANDEELDPILETQRAAVICRRIIEQDLVTKEECVVLHRACSLDSEGISVPKADAARIFQENIARRLQTSEQLDKISLEIVQATLTSVMRLFVEHGALIQLERNQHIVDHKVPKNPKKLDDIAKLLGRIDREYWLSVEANHGKSALVSAVSSIKKVLRKTTIHAPELGQWKGHG